MAGTNKTASQGADQALNQWKYDIANELNVQLGGDRTSRENGSVGGLMTKRMIQFAEENLKRGARI